MTVQYKVVNIPDFLTDLETYLNNIGQTGWELIGINPAGQAFFQSGSSIDGISLTGSLVIPAGTVSSSAQVKAYLPSGTVSSSGQVSYEGLTNIPNNIVSSSAQFISLTAPFTGSFTGSFVGSLSAHGNVKIQSGSNMPMGTAVLDGANPGTVTVSNTLVTSASIILLTKQTAVHPGNVSISAKSANSFTILSDHNGDDDTVGYVILNPI